MLSTTRRSPLARWLLVAVLALLTALLGTGGAAAAPAPRPVVVVGASGLTWDDVTPQRMPALAALAAQGGTASLVVRTVHASTCATDGWLTLGAGARATGPAGPCRPPVVGEHGAVAGWAADVAATQDSLSGARLGSLATSLAGAKGCVAAIGPGAGVATAASATKGVSRGWAGPFSPATVAQGVGRCGVTLVDVGGVSGTGPARDTALRALDARIGQALAAAGSRADVVVAGLADGPAPARLRPVVVRSAATNGRVLQSPSTRRDGLVLLTDLTPTIASMRGVLAPTTWTGRALTPGPVVAAAQRLDRHRDVDLLDRRAHAAITPFFVGWGIVLVGGLLAVAAAWRLGALGGSRARRLAAQLGTVLAAVPAATFLARLVPWWRSSAPTLTVTAVTWALAAAVALLAWAGPWRRHPLGPAAVVALVTMLVIGGDVATGSHLTISSFIGEHPSIGGRFYGLGNASSALLAAATLLVMTAIIELGLDTRHTRLAAVAALVLGLAVVAFTATIGADFGGPIALLPAVLYLGLRGLGMRLDAGRALVLGLLAAGLVVALSLADWLRAPAERTHLGRFVETLLAGGGDDVIGRKLVQNWDTFTASPLTIATPLVTLLLALAVWRPSRIPGRPLTPAFRAVPLLRLGLLAIFLMLVVAMLANDTGATVPAPAGLLVGPLAIGALLLAGAGRERSGATARTSRTD